MLILAWLLNRWIKFTDSPVPASTAFIVGFEHVNHGFLYGNEPGKVCHVNRLFTRLLNQIRHMDIYFHLSETHGSLTLYGVWDDNHILFGIVVSLIVYFTRDHFWHATLSKHTIYNRCYFLSSDHNRLPNCSFAFFVARSFSLCTVAGKSFIAFNCAGRITLYPLAST